MKQVLALLAMTILGILTPVFAHADMSEVKVCSLRDAKKVVSFAEDKNTKRLKIVSVETMKAQDVLVVTPIMEALFKGIVLIPVQGQYEKGTLESVSHVLTVDEVPGSDKKHLYVDSVMQVRRVLMISKLMDTPFSAPVLCFAD